MANYKESGVDVEEGYRAVNKYKEHAKRTAIPGLLTGLGSFNGMFEIPKGYKNPVMVSGTDGVGTKLDVAFQMKKYDTVGIDCVGVLYGFGDRDELRDAVAIAETVEDLERILL